MLAKKFGAAIVSLEHRYYGESSPFEELTTDNLTYLSSKQALFDLAVFRNYYQVAIVISPGCGTCSFFEVAVVFCERL